MSVEPDPKFQGLAPPSKNFWLRLQPSQIASVPVPQPWLQGVMSILLFSSRRKLKTTTFQEREQRAAGERRPASALQARREVEGHIDRPAKRRHSQLSKSLEQRSHPGHVLHVMSLWPATVSDVDRNERAIFSPKFISFDGSPMKMSYASGRRHLLFSSVKGRKKLIRVDRASTDQPSSNPTRACTFTRRFQVASASWCV